MLISLDVSNIDNQHICCAISNKKDATSKKDWLKERFDDGIVFTKLDDRGKVFIEYLPVEKAWSPIEGEDLYFINCFWVSGKFKGKGYANALLNSCIERAKKDGKKGICVVSSDKKKPFLSDPAYLKHRGFEIVDRAAPYFTLLFLPLSEDAIAPSFSCQLKNHTMHEEGATIYYSHQCPHTEKYVTLVKEAAVRAQLPLRVVYIDSREKALACPSPFTTYAFYINGEFIGNEILTVKKFLAMMEEKYETRMA